MPNSHLCTNHIFSSYFIFYQVNILILNHNHDTDRLTHYNSKNITTRSPEDRITGRECGLSAFLLLPSFHINAQIPM